MENTAPFDLNAAVQQWRAELASSPALRQDNLDELECHLRDSVDNLHSRGLAVEESFWLAKRRLGMSDALKREFCIINPRRVWLDRAVWIIGGSLLLQIVFHLANLASSSTVFLASRWTAQPTLLAPIGLGAYCFALASEMAAVWLGIVRAPNALNRLGVWIRANPLLAAGGLVLPLLLFTGANSFLTMLTVKHLPMASVGVISIWRSIAGFAVGILMWPAVLAWLLSTRAKQAAAR